MSLAPQLDGQAIKLTKKSFVSRSARRRHLPFEFVISSGRECGTAENFAYLVFAEAEVVDGPHVAELDHLDLCVAPVFGHRNVGRRFAGRWR